MTIVLIVVVGLGRGDSCNLLVLYSELNGSGDLVDKSIFKGITLSSDKSLAIKIVGYNIMSFHVHH